MLLISTYGYTMESQLIIFISVNNDIQTTVQIFTQLLSYHKYIQFFIVEFIGFENS
jgi:hypothetical protein